MIALLFMLPLLVGAFLFSDSDSGEEPETEIDGTDGDDTLHGTNRGETLNGNGGDDILWGWGGADTLEGGAGNDMLNSGDGNDIVNGSAGNDRIYGGLGDDTLSGGDGDDILHDGQGNNTMTGGDGQDVFEIDVHTASDMVNGVTYITDFDHDDDTIVINRLDLGPLDSPFPGAEFSLEDWTDGIGQNIYYDGELIVSIAGAQFSNIGAAGIEFGAEITGSDGNDALSGHQANDTLYGGGGDDVIDGVHGDDLVIGGDGNDTLSGGIGEGIVSLYPGWPDIPEYDGNDTLLGGAGDDTLYGGPGHDTLTGGEGEDVFQFARYREGDMTTITDFDPAEDRLVIQEIAFYGLDTPLSGGGLTIEDWADGTGANILYDSHLIASVTGAQGLDPALIEIVGEVTGSLGDDTLSGGDGDDRFYGHEGNDTLNGGNGDDRLRGGNGDDTLNGGEGNDDLSGGDGDDALYGGDGDDALYGGEGSDTLTGGDGDDHMYSGDSYSGAGFTDTLNGGRGDDILVGRGESLSLNEVIYNGGEGNDQIWGGSGNEILNGNEGSDTLTGGSGNDVFLLGNYSVGDIDTITDFDRSQDSILIEIETGSYFSPPHTVTIEDWLDGTGADVLLNGTILARVTGAQGLDPALISVLT